MNLFSSLNLLAFIIYLYLVLHIMIKNPQPLIRKLCAGFISCLALWSLCRVFVYNPQVSEAVAKLFTNIGSLGWLSSGSFYLGFALLFNEKKALLKKKSVYLPLILLPLLLIAAQWAGLVVDTYKKEAFGWKPILAKSPWPWIFVGYFMLFMGIALREIFRVWRKSPDNRKRKQARVIFFSMLIPVTIGLSIDAIDALLPALNIHRCPNMSNFLALIWAMGLVYAMARHKFLAIMPAEIPDNFNPPTLDWLIFLNPQGKIISLNDEAIRLLGYREGALKGEPVSTILESGGDAANLVEQVLDFKGLQNREVIFRSKKGKKIPVTFSASLMRNESGAVEGIVCVARDITELKRHETIKDVLLNISEAVRRAVTLRELLQIIQQQVARLMEAGNFYVALVHDHEKSLYTFPFIVDENPEELEEPGRSVLLKHSFTDYVCRNQKPLLADKKKYDELAKQEDIRLLGKKPRSWMGVPLKTPEDEVIGVVVVQSYTDESAYSESDMDMLSIISNTIAGAIKYKQTEEAMRTSEEQYRRLVDNMQDGVFLIYNRKLEFINNAFVRMIGYPMEEVVGKDFKTFIAPEDMEIVESRYLKRLQGKNIPEEYEFRVVHRDGASVYVNMQVGLVNYKDGTATMGTLKDITGKKQAEKEKKELEEKLARSEKMEAIGRLAGGVAHDLNNLLSAIVSYPDLLLMKLPPESPLRKPVITIKQSGERAAAIVQDLLTLAGRGVTVTKTEHLNRIISDYLGSPEFEKLVKQNPHVHFIPRLQNDLPFIKGSAIHLAKAVMNLVNNAAEAIPAGGEVVISTGTRTVDKPIAGYYQTIARGNYVVLTVSDTGVGIDPGDLGKILDPFYSKKILGRKGTGLGMSVVWGTLEDHKGFIDVKSVLNQGTTFDLYFPVTDEIDSYQGEIGNIPLNKYRGKGEKILVVDDEYDQREIASVLLTELGYTVYTVSGGEEAVEYMKIQNADLLLLDMLMDPGMDGLDTYREILKIRPGMKALITSGFSESDRVKEALKLGAGVYIKKPYTMEKIGLAVTSELHK